MINQHRIRLNLQLRYKGRTYSWYEDIKIVTDNWVRACQPGAVIEVASVDLCEKDGKNADNIT